MIEQVTLARSSPLESERVAAIDAAKGVIPIIRARLADNIHMAAMFELSFQDFMSSAFWQDNWISEAKGPFQEFQAFADKLIERCRDAKTAFENLGKSDVP
jgi:hypothetical protein